jgi:hypothetical protein
MSKAAQCAENEAERHCISATLFRFARVSHHDTQKLFIKNYFDLTLRRSVGGFILSRPESAFGFAGEGREGLGGELLLGARI